MRSLTLIAFLLTALCACSTPAPDPGPKFANAAPDPACMQHQPQPPGPRYTDEELRRTEETLSVLRYYTANTGKPYCDAQGPTDTDRAWAKLYVDLGADRTNVAALLD